jgi:GntR family transcriptional regulator, carbon starvation induced regulator
MPRKSALSVISPTTGVAQEGMSRSSVVYERLREDLLHGDLKAGDKLAVATLSERYAFGASPVREALSRLSSEGLVERIDQRGFRAAVVDFSEVPLLTQTRCELEGLALRQSIALRNVAWEERLVVIVHRLSKTPRSLSQTSYVRNPVWEELHGEFHASLIENCPSRWMRQFCKTMAEEAFRFRQVAASINYAKRDEHAEHVALFQASINGDADKAVALLNAHYQRTAHLTSQAVNPSGS